jgi:hypothetical protein
MANTKPQLEEMQPSRKRKLDESLADEDSGSKAKKMLPAKPADGSSFGKRMLEV